jgi:multiple sugar transport system permease protein
LTIRQSYQGYLRDAYHNDFKQLPNDIRKSATTFGNLVPPTSGRRLAVFEAHGLSKALQSNPVELRWLTYTQGGDASNKDLATATAITLPIESYEREFVQVHASALRSEFAGRNFSYVFSYLTENGGAVLNTLIYCSLAISVTLTLNVLAAYALSWFPIAASGKILVFQLATMAFPAEVTMIPNFLLPKNLHLLNTCAALILLSAASGYMLFLLKGFFDSLPSELFEAGAMDGASESKMLWRIALH